MNHKKIYPLAMLLSGSFMSYSIGPVLQPGQKYSQMALIQQGALLKNKIAPSTKSTASKPISAPLSKSTSAPTSGPAPKKVSVKTREWGAEYDKLKSCYAEVSTDREKLDQFRKKHISTFQSMKNMPNANYNALAKEITTDFIAYVQQILSETVGKLGPAPVKFSVFTMGSMARDESGFYTDLEIGFIVEKKNRQVLEYFTKASQVLADRLFLIGEHPDVDGKGLRLDEADNGPSHLRWFARYASNDQARQILNGALVKRDFDKIPFSGSRLFIATPDELAMHTHANPPVQSMTKAERTALIENEFKRSLKDPKNRGIPPAELFNKVKAAMDLMTKPLSAKEQRTSSNISDLSRNMRHLYGDENIFNSYLKKREEHLRGKSKYDNPFYQNRREEIAYRKMKADLLKFSEDAESAIIKGKLSDTIDIKGELYRFPEQILTDLGFWYNLPEQNTTKIAIELAKRGLMSKELSDQLVDLMNFVIQLRLKKQSMLKKQVKEIPTTTEEYLDMKKELEDELKNLVASRNFQDASFTPQAEKELIDKKITKLRVQLNDFKKMVPAVPNAILEKKDIELLNTKYLPILKKFFEMAKDFVKGNKQAFTNKTLPRLP